MSTSEISAEVLELAQHICEVRKSRTIRRGTPDVVSALVNGVEIPHGTLIWKSSWYGVEQAGYIVAVDPNRRTYVEVADKPYSPRRYPLPEQSLSQKRTVLCFDYSVIFVTYSEAVEHHIRLKQAAVDNAAKTLAKCTEDLHKAEALRESPSSQK